MGRHKKAVAGNDGVELPDLDISLDFDIADDRTDASLFAEEEEVTELDSRYLTPRLRRLRSNFVMYDNAVKLAREVKIRDNERVDVIVSGAFIFGDFIEAFLTETPCKAIKMTISTLSLSAANVDSLRGLMQKGYIDELNLIVSDYFYSHEIRGLIPYIYSNLDIEDRFQLAVGGVHTKTVHFITLGGKKIVMQGSANLRSSASIEQFSMEENADLYDFYDECFDKILDHYKTINKPIRVSPLWKLLTTKKFND